MFYFVRFLRKMWRLFNAAEKFRFIYERIAKILAVCHMHHMKEKISHSSGRLQFSEKKKINRGHTAVPVRKQMERSPSQRKFFRKKRIAFLGCPFIRLLSTFGSFCTISSYHKNHFLYPGQLLVKRNIVFPFLFNRNN